MTADSAPAEESIASRPTLGIGACLAGKPVRYNGQTKSPNDHVRSLGEAFEMR